MGIGQKKLAERTVSTWVCIHKTGGAGESVYRVCSGRKCMVTGRCPWIIHSLFYKGKFISHKPKSEKGLEKLMQLL